MSLSLPHPVRNSAERLPPLDEAALTRAFRSFTEAAGSLEHSYGQLQAELARMRGKLEESNRDLAQSLEENQRMRQHLKQILETLPCGVVVVEESGRVSLANREAGRYLPATSDQPLPGWADTMVRSLPAGYGELEYRPGPAAQWISIRRAQLEEPDSSRMILVLEDISARKRLAQSQECLRRREALAQMSALLAHEIRNPLGSLELFAGLLSQSGLSAEQQEWTGHLQAGLRRLGATVNNVLHFHSQARPQFALTDLGAVLRSLQAFLQPLARQVGVIVELSDELGHRQIAADRHRLEQVFLNLALNAFKFVAKGGRLRISGRLRPEDDLDVVVEIADSGPGIAPENIEHIFEPGFTTQEGSPGLGLAVSKTIMEQHGGSITVASTPGYGTTFSLRFRGGPQ